MDDMKKLFNTLKSIDGTLKRIEQLLKKGTCIPKINGEEIKKAVESRNDAGISFR